MKWLKYQHKFSSGTRTWIWVPLHVEEITEQEIKDSGFLDSITDEYSYSDKYHGIDFEIVDKPPSWVVAREGRRLALAEEAATLAYRKWQDYTHSLTIDGPGWEDCKQCVNATAARDRHGDRVVVNCPLCGQEVFRDTLKYWLMPDDQAAVKLLCSLVEQGARSVKSATRWPVEDEEEEKAFSRLVKLGLASGSVHHQKHEICATLQGATEWQKHKQG
jgi:hypothetical protein